VIDIYKLESSNYGVKALTDKERFEAYNLMKETMSVQMMSINEIDIEKIRPGANILQINVYLCALVARTDMSKPYFSHSYI